MADYYCVSVCVCVWIGGKIQFYLDRKITRAALRIMPLKEENKDRERERERRKESGLRHPGSREECVCSGDKLAD